MSVDDLPLVTVLIPVRDEEANILGCLEAVLAQDHPLDRLEVIMVDGVSTDDTAVLADAFLRASALERWKVLSNPRADTPSNLNLGLGQASGEVLCRVDARSRIPEHYARQCAELLGARPDVVVVGGSQVAVPPHWSARGRGIARALNNRWGMGLSRYRRGASSGISDTVYLGAFRTADLRAAGGWDERLKTNQDFDLNRRLSRSGSVWFDAMLPVAYVPRSSVREILAQHHRFGRWKVRFWRMSGSRPQPRQLLLLAAPALACSALLLLRRPLLHHLPIVMVLGIGVAAFVEGAGTSGPDGGLRSRGTALVTLLCVSLGWLSGVFRELLVGSRD